jgi:hypothetical protein
MLRGAALAEGGALERAGLPPQDGGGDAGSRSRSRIGLWDGGGDAASGAGEGAGALGNRDLRSAAEGAGPGKAALRIQAGGKGLQRGGEQPHVRPSARRASRLVAVLPGTRSMSR